MESQRDAVSGLHTTCVVLQPRYAPATSCPPPARRAARALNSTQAMINLTSACVYVLAAIQRLLHGDVRPSRSFQYYLSVSHLRLQGTPGSLAWLEVRIKDRPDAVEHGFRCSLVPRRLS